jgi:hypothetical protein
MLTKEMQMGEQKELFDINDMTSGDRKIAFAIIILSFTFLFALLAFLVYMFWDFGIAGRVVLFLICVLVLVEIAKILVKSVLDWSQRR